MHTRKLPKSPITYCSSGTGKQIASTSYLRQLAAEAVLLVPGSHFEDVAGDDVTEVACLTILFLSVQIGNHKTVVVRDTYVVPGESAQTVFQEVETPELDKCHSDVVQIHLCTRQPRSFALL